MRWLYFIALAINDFKNDCLKALNKEISSLQKVYEAQVSYEEKKNWLMLDIARLEAELIDRSEICEYHLVDFTLKRK